jgi:hypothetical protein
MTDSRHITQINRETGDYIVRIKSHRVPDPVAVAIEEILHNLRSSLDLLAWELHVVNEAPPQPLPDGSPWRRIQFPI